MKILPDEVYRPPQLPDLDIVATSVADALDDFDENRGRGILPSEVYRRPESPTFEAFTDATIDALDHLHENSAHFVYDEAKFKEFLDYLESEDLGNQSVIKTARADLERDTPQAMMNLFIKTELVATPVGVIAGIAEASSGQGGVLEVYATASIIRAVVSYKLSKDVVDHRVTLAAGEMIPHLGRFTVFVMLAEEHPELTRLLWAYRGCRKMLREKVIDNGKIETRFEKAMSSNVLEFIIGPKEFTQGCILKWKLNSKVLETGLGVMNIIGLR